jgi:plasmid stabilization system protein ParE
LDKYQISLFAAAYRNLDEIYQYIATELDSAETALNLIEKLEDAILSLEVMPFRGVRRRVGAFAKKEYRQLFVNDFTIVYRIEELKKQVFIVTIRYSKSQF